MRTLVRDSMAAPSARRVLLAAASVPAARFPAPALPAAADWKATGISQTSKLARDALAMQWIRSAQTMSTRRALQDAGIRGMTGKRTLRRGVTEHHDANEGPPLRTSVRPTQTPRISPVTKLPRSVMKGARAPGGLSQGPRRGVLEGNSVEVSLLL